MPNRGRKHKVIERIAVCFLAMTVVISGYAPSSFSFAMAEESTNVDQTTTSVAQTSDLQKSDGTETTESSSNTATNSDEITEQNTDAEKAAAEKAAAEKAAAEKAAAEKAAAEKAAADKAAAEKAAADKTEADKAAADKAAADKTEADNSQTDKAAADKAAEDNKEVNTEGVLSDEAKAAAEAKAAEEKEIVDELIQGTMVNVQMLFSPEMFRSSDALEAGQLSVNKTAEAVKGKNKLWDMELSLTGKDKQTSTDVVMVLDRSGSMGEDNDKKLISLKSSATEMINTLIPTSEQGNLGIGIVSYAGDMTVTGITNDTTSLKNAVNNLNANGGTFTQGGIHEARNLLARSNAKDKFIIVISDGEATYGYDVKNNWKEYTESGYTSQNMPISCMDYQNEIGKGRYTTVYKGMDWTRVYYVDFPNQAISEANIAKNDNINMYSVALGSDKNFTLNMDKIGIDGHYTANTKDLAKTFSDIMKQISYAASDAVVVDPIGEEFNIPGITSGNANDKIKVVDKNGDDIEGASVSYNEETRTFTANIGNVTEDLSPIKIKYQLKIKNGVKAGEVYPTNGKTTVAYIDSDGISATKEFDPIPRVGIKAATITQYNLFVDESGNLLKTEVANYGQPAINFSDATISTVSIDKIDGKNIKLNKDYTINIPKKTIPISEEKEYRFEKISQVKGTDSSTLNTNDESTVVNFKSYGNRNLYYTFKLHTMEDFQLSYHSNYGASEEVKTTGQAEGSEFEATNTFSRPGFDFVGWNTKADNSGDKIENGKKMTMPASNLDLYAQWQRNDSKWKELSFNAGDGTGEMASESRIIGETEALPEETFTHLGYKFAGWKVKDSSDTKVYSDREDFTMPNKDTELVAQWEKDNSQWKELSFDANGGKNTMEAKSRISGETKALPSNEFTNPGYKFVGWKVKDSSDTRVYSDKEEFTMPNKDTELVAQWQKDYSQWKKLSFDANGGKNTMEAKSRISGETEALPNNKFTKPGYKFVGWKVKDSSDTTVYLDKADFTMPNKDTELVAQWGEDNSQWKELSFGAGDGTGEMGVEKRIIGETEALPEETFTYLGYKFVGWKVKDSSDTIVYSDKADFTMPNEDTELIAQWEEDDSQWHVLSFNSDNGKGEMKAEKRISGVSKILPANLFSKVGYIFDGWKVNGGVDTNTYPDKSSYTMPNANTELIAQWRMNPSEWYELSFDANGGSGDMVSQDRIGGQTKALPSNEFTKKGYEFAGWIIDNKIPGTTFEDKEDFTMPNKDTELVAQWKKDYSDGFLDVKYEKGDHGSLEGTETYYADPTKKLGEVASASKVNPNDGYVFDKWSPEYDADKFANDYSSSIKTVGDPLTARTLTFTATYKKDSTKWFDLTYDANGGNGTAMETENIQAGTDKNLTANTYTKRGYKFTGWLVKDSTDTTLYADKADFTMPGANVTLLAQWGKDYSDGYLDVKYEKGDHGSLEGTETYYADPTKKLGEVASASKVNPNDGYVFDKWSPEYDADKFANDYSSSIKTVGDPLTARTLTFTATYKKDSTKWFDLTYDANGGNGTAMETENIQTGTDKNLTANTYTKPGYKFTGWLVKDSTDTTLYADKADFTMPGANVTLLAQWEKDYSDGFLDVKYVAGANGELVGTTEFYINPADVLGEVAQAPTTDAATNYRFDKWSPLYDEEKTANDYSSDIIETEEPLTTRTLTFTASFKRLSSGGGDDDGTPESIFNLKSVVKNGSIIGDNAFTANEGETVELGYVEANTGYVLDTVDVIVNETSTSVYKNGSAMPVALEKNGNKYRYMVSNVQGDTDVLYKFVKEDSGTPQGGNDGENVKPESGEGTPQAAVITPNDGTNNTMDNVAQTGDDFKLIYWAIILLIASAMAIVVIKKSYRKKEDTK